MNLHRVLEHWEEYELRKQEEANTFRTSEQWEVDFLLQKILLHFPYFEVSRVRRAIMLCGTRFGGTVARRDLVECTMMRLGLIPTDIKHTSHDKSKSY